MNAPASCNLMLQGAAHVPPARSEAAEACSGRPAIVLLLRQLYNQGCWCIRGWCNTAYPLVGLQKWKCRCSRGHADGLGAERPTSDEGE